MYFELSLIDVKVLITRGDSFQIDYKNCHKENFFVEEVEDKISVKQKNEEGTREYKDGLLFGLLKIYISDIPIIHIKVPSDIKFIDINANYSSIKCDNLDVNEIKILLDSGKINIDNVSADLIDLKVVNGIVKAKDINIKERFSAKVKNGKINLEKYISDTEGIDIGCINGFMKFYGRRIKSRYKINGSPMYELKCHNGIVSLSR